MAKNRKFAEGEVPEPTFDKQMESYSEEETNADDPIFSSAYHKFMSNLLKTRDKAVKDELIEEVGKLFIEHNKTILDSIDELLAIQTATVGRVVGEVMSSLEIIQKDNVREHKLIMDDLKIFKANLLLDEELLKIHEKRLNEKAIRIATLQQNEAKLSLKMKTLEEKVHIDIPEDVIAFIKDIKDFAPAIKQIAKTQKYWNLVSLAVYITATAIMLYHFLT
jgi:hypothetical protein